MTRRPRSEPVAPEGLPIQQVSELLGVPAPTIRSWERRYHVPATRRTIGGHRRYFADELQQLRLMRDDIARGMRAADAARGVRVLLDRDHPTRDRVTAVLAASQALDGRALQIALDASRDELGLGATLDHVVLPAMRQVGAWWEAGRCGIGQEHFTTETVRSWLARITTLAPVTPDGPPLILACGPRDLHTLGLEAMAALLAEQGRGARVLGAHVSGPDLAAAAGATPDTQLVVVSHLPSHRRTTIDAMQAAEHTGASVYYAGNAFAFPYQRTDVPGTYLGGSLVGAVALLLGSRPSTGEA